MLTTRSVKKRFGSRLCRDCMNREYGVDLRRRDVFYVYSDKECPYCYANKHLVRGFKPSGLVKMLFKH